ncbi:nuclear pore complex protein NUP98A-like isoform X3 [Magnolia sinica]|uniref:nuclear pore complex protein NUP98A-like isoform X3 n=1 Tax=Magnolia sinica TaxID=86752 RepID=UPI00265B66CA|nr:nuclear pore complex protein NUP98A-like isoform X3 [Magnolia sinica]
MGSYISSSLAALNPLPKSKKKGNSRRKILRNSTSFYLPCPKKSRKISIRVNQTRHGAFGQSSSSPFGTQSVFGQTNNASSNPFAPKPFGNTSPFGSPTGGSIFGGTSTGVFGVTQSSSPLASTPAFGASSTLGFGGSMPAFGASSTPAFGSASSTPAFGSSLFGQKSTFGGFGSTSSQTSPFGSAFQQAQPAFGSNLFGSTPAFGATGTPAFGATSTPAFGATSTPAFGTTGTPAFGAASTQAFGSTATPTFGSTGTAFGVSSAPAFGSTGTPAFGSTGTPAFGASSTPLFGSSSAPAFGASSTPAFGSSASAFGASSTPSFSFGSSPAFGQSTSAFGSSPFGTTPSPFGVQSSPFASQATTPTFVSPGFGQSAFGGQHGGSRVAAYTPTAEVDGGTSTQPAGKLESISAMPSYKDKSHEELRWEDYQRGDKGGPNPTGQPAGGIFSAPSQSNPFGPTGTFGQTPANPFSSTSSNPFAQKTPTFGNTGFGSSSTPAFNSPFGTSSSSPFRATSTPTPSIFGAPSAPAFGASSSPSPFGASSMPSIGSSPSLFGSSSAPGTGPAFGSSFGTQSSGLFQSSTPSLGQMAPAFVQTPLFGQTTPPAFGQTNLFNPQSTGFGGNSFTSNPLPSLLGTNNPVGFGQTIQPSLSSAIQLGAPAQSSGAFSFGNFGQTSAASSGFGGTSNVFGQGTFGQFAASQNNVIAQPVPVENPFGTLPAMPQMSIGRAGSAPSVQYGISSMPVGNKPTLVRVSPLLTPRHLSQRRIRLPARKYHPRNDGLKVPFFSDDEETPSTPKADALFIPRENPRALVIRPMDQWPTRSSAEKQSPLKDTDAPVHQNGVSLKKRYDIFKAKCGKRKKSRGHKNMGHAVLLVVGSIISGEASAPALNGSFSQDHDVSPSENGLDSQQNVSPAKSTQKPQGTHEDHAHKGNSYITISGHRAGEAAIVYEHGADIEALMPKLRHADYYTEPRVQELAAKERAEPGYCRHVKDFVVGRHSYGSIKFLGVTDVRRLDLESLIQFNNREVIVYMDENKKPPIGQGLNKPAEVTLLNIKCINKKTGEQYTEGPKVEKYKEMLMKKTQDQGAQFISYDPVKGEWKFNVDHFSRYEFCDIEDFCASFFSNCNLCLCSISDCKK